jgi:exodeoxyribonuclease V beta subunit
MKIDCVPLEGLNLIEASAGTGKTHALTSLYLRLLVEQGLGPESILVMTYTNAATAELKTRIRGRLLHTREAFSNGHAEDPMLQDLLQRQTDHGVVCRHLDLALANFDQAAIHTIHGFCQRVLSDYAFESGQAFKTELVVDPWPRQQQLVDDFWRREFADLPSDLLGPILTGFSTPEQLLQSLRPALGKPYLNVLADEWPESFSALLERVGNKQAELHALWVQDRELIRSLLCDNRVLNGRSYRKDYVSGWCEAMDRMLVSDPCESPDKNAHRFTEGSLRAALKPGMDLPEHRFFQKIGELLDLKQACIDARLSALSALLKRAYDTLNLELPKRMKLANEWSYDDLLLQLHESLGKDHSGQLKTRLRKRYPAALIDEFQDTDPVQFEIIQQIYDHPGARVFFVGDPKQAIYGFRGADIYTYLRTRDNPSTRRHTLAVNWRSTPAMIRAVNCLFENASNPFFDPRIGFEPVHPAPSPMGGNGKDYVGLSGSALHLWHLQETGGATIDEVRQAVADATAGEVARLLSSRVKVDGRALQGSDMAILVRTHKQGDQLALALRRRGITSVSNTRYSVYQTPEAQALERLLLALLEPHRIALLRTALATPLLGWDGAGIDALNSDERAQSTITQRFYNAHQTWSQRGFIVMFRNLMQTFDIENRLLAFTDGERRLTNLYHLLELCQQYDSAQRPGMEGLVAWYRRQCQSEDTSDEHLLRLESDGHWVRIVTLHQSKGLEYGIVFCPFLWDDNPIRTPSVPFQFHDPQHRDAAMLELRYTQTQHSQSFYKGEALAESLRLLYVGLTRARYRCYVPWGLFKQNRQSALCWLLHRGGAIAQDQDVALWTAATKKLSDADDRARLQELCELSGGAITCTAMPSDSAKVQQSLALPARLESARILRNNAWPFRQVVSFSSMITGLSEDLPDHDEQTSVVAPASDPEAQWNVHGFPRGSGPGSCLHSILETLDFSCDDTSQVATLVDETLVFYGIELRWSPVVVAWMKHIVQTPLNDRGLCLRDVDHTGRRNEMGFHFPLHAFKPQQIRRLADRYLFTDSQALLAGLERVSATTVDGYVKGFIDLIFVWEERYYLADYKSNWLGWAATDYHPQALHQAMLEHHYPLQYLLYTLALHRYLKWRLTDYDYDRHVGGVFYLFLRGMHPQNSTPLGVVSERPSKAFIEALDRLVAGEEG